MSSVALVKRARNEDEEKVLAKRAKTDDDDDAPARTSGLAAPIMALTGHEAGIMSLRFDPTGKYVATGSLDKHIFLWHVYGNCENTHVFKGHKNAVLQVDWSLDGHQVCSASADKTVCVWDVESGRRLKKFAEHTSHVNSVCTAREDAHLLVSASDDCSAKMWDTRVRRSLQSFNLPFQQTAVALSADDQLVFTGGIDNVVKAWDRRKMQVSFTLPGHTDTITSLRLSPDGSYLLSNAMDSSLRIWDVRPYAPAERCIKKIDGAVHNFEKNLLRCNWSPDGRRITAGSADRFVYVWDTTKRQILYKLPGHVGSVNEVDFHPKEPIVGSCSSDRKVFLGEISAYSSV
jgi:Prp8 binding protein